MEYSPEIIDDLMLELSLASALPLASGGRDMIRVIASINAIGCIAKDLTPRELKALEYAISPLLSLMAADIEEPSAEKAAFTLSCLMASRVCVNQLVSSEGLLTIGKVFDALLSTDRNLDLESASVSRCLVENLSLVYRSVSLHFPWEVVRVGAIRHCVMLLRRGGLTARTNVAGVLAALSADLDICKLMFANGAVKPILNVCDADVTNEPCMLAGLGCIAQFARIYDICIKMARQGVVKVLEKGLHRETGYAHYAIREKAVCALLWLSQTQPVRHLIATDDMLSGLVKQFTIGSESSKYQVVEILLCLHSTYDAEKEVVLIRQVRDDVFSFLSTDQSEWRQRNIVLKAMCVLYRTNEDKWYFMNNGILKIIFGSMTAKLKDLQECSFVLLLSLCAHPDIPPIIILEGGAEVISQTLSTLPPPVTADLCGVILKTLALYNWDVVENAVRDKVPHDIYNSSLLRSPDCALFGSEHGQFVEEYLQKIVSNRRSQTYLLQQLNDEEILSLGIPSNLLESYQKGFMELDQACRGFLEIDALKVVMVLLGESLDDEELEDIFNEYDPLLTGRMDFKSFLKLMKGWKEKFGIGATGMMNNITQRGILGRAKKTMGAWWNQNTVAKNELLRVKANKAEEKAQIQLLAEKYLPNEVTRLQRRKEEEIKRPKASSRKISPVYY